MKTYFLFLLAAIIPLTVIPANTFATVVDYDDETQQEEECKEQNDYAFLCSGNSGVNGLPFCDKYNATQRAEQFPNITQGSCFDRTTDPIAFCEEFDDLTNSYEDCRQVPGTEEYIEYMATGGPDESCLFDVSQIKCLPFPGADDCPEGFGNNEDDRCFPVNENGNWACPEGYHDVDDDESGQCYPNSEECEYDDYVPDPEDEGDRCAYLGYMCNEGDENSDHPRCEEFLEERAEGKAEAELN
jgi:hypothetical protein